MSAPMMTGTVEQAFQRLVWLESISDRESGCTPGTYTRCRLVIECWPTNEVVPFIRPFDDALIIGDDAHSAEVRVTSGSVALVIWDWDTDAYAELYSSLRRGPLRRALQQWLQAIEQTQTFDEWDSTTTTTP